MDKEFEDWKVRSLYFCQKASIYEVKMMYAIEKAIESLYSFRCNLSRLSGDYSEAEISKIISNLTSFRYFIQHNKG